MASDLVSTIGQTNPDNIQFSLNNQDNYSGEDKDSVVVLTFHVLLGHQHVLNPFYFKSTNNDTGTVVDIFAAGMYPWDTQSINPAPITRLHS